MKFIVKYGIFALSIYILLIVGLLFQWFVFGELNVYEQVSVVVLTIVIYVPFVALQIRDRINLN